MHDEATSSESEGRPARGADEAPRWRWAFRTTEDQVIQFLNTPTSLPLGAVSISFMAGLPNGFHIVWFE